MRASSVSHGIRGIFPLIRTLVPNAISPPFALPALQGLRLAIDATLLVQRLHFADDPLPSRHVIGFYRLISSLRQHGVMPIMVFDHPRKRLALKDREQVKRRHKRELDKIRSKLEHERRGRLQELQAHLDALSTLQESERRQVGDLLDEWRQQSQQKLSEKLSQPSTSTAPPSQPQPIALTPPPLPEAPTKPQSVAYSMHTNWLQIEENLRSGGSSQSKGQKVLAEAEKEIYHTIAAQLKSGEAPQPLPPIQEGLDTAIGTTDATPLHPLSSLNAMHHSLTKTYNRATSPPSASIYQDCATLSSLMAVPVFWTGDGTRTGGGRIHEAEAYAASLVRSGFADLVASEDSDVLLYEAPLLRGRMGGVRSPGVLTREAGRGKLEVVCGTRARTGLFPKPEVEKLIQLHTGSDSTAMTSGNAEPYDRTTRALMLDFALLCGTDFNRTIPGIGPKTGLRLLKEHGSISTILHKESKKFRPPDGLSIREYGTELRNARSVFLMPPKVRAAARSILGTAASGAAAKMVGQQGVASPVERTLFAEATPTSAEISNEVHIAAAEVTNTACSAEPAVESSSVLAVASTIETVSSGEDGALNSASSDVSADSATTAIVSYDRQAVHEFLRSHGVFRPTLSSSDDDPDSPLEEFNSLTREQEWRDLLDLELGLTSSTSSSSAASLSDFHSVLEEQSRDTEGAMGTATLGADFFGEHKAVACWNPQMEQHVREETTARRHTN